MDLVKSLKLAVPVVTKSVSMSDTLYHGRRVINFYQFAYRARLAIAKHVDDGRHFANIKVHADIERFACLFFISTVIQTSIELVIDGAAGQVGETPPQIRLNQLRRVGIHQRRDVIRGQVLRVVERAGLDQTVQG